MRCVYVCMQLRKGGCDELTFPVSDLDTESNKRRGCLWAGFASSHSSGRATVYSVRFADCPRLCLGLHIHAGRGSVKGEQGLMANDLRFHLETAEI